MASTRASSRASVRVATALTAAVRISVTAEASSIAVGTAGVAVEQGHDPLVGVEAQAGIAGHDADRLEREHPRRRRPRQAGIRPMNPGAPGATITERSGMNVSPRAWAASTSAIASAHAAGSSAATTSS